MLEQIANRRVRKENTMFKFSLANFFRLACVLSLIILISSCDYEEYYTYTIRNESSRPVVVTIERAFVNSGESALVIDTIAVKETKEVIDHYGGITSREASPPRYQEFYKFKSFSVQRIDSSFAKTDFMVESNWNYSTQRKNRKGLYHYTVTEEDF